ncbi:hypothetical protein AGMMS49975_17250 [Clostridia bacterium]|nr:hypothetical protein AGMMS49975_17250 [Clostridia bacterium]
MGLGFSGGFNNLRIDFERFDVSDFVGTVGTRVNNRVSGDFGNVVVGVNNVYLSVSGGGSCSSAVLTYVPRYIYGV